MIILTSIEPYPNKLDNHATFQSSMECEMKHIFQSMPSESFASLFYTQVIGGDIGKVDRLAGWPSGHLAGWLAGWLRSWLGF